MSKKVKLIIGIGVVGVIIVGGVVYNFIASSSKGTANASNLLNKPKTEQTSSKAEKINANNKKNTEKEHSKDTKKVNETTNKAKAETTAPQNTSTPVPADIVGNQSNVAESCYVSTFGPKPAFPKIVENDNNNFLELVSVYASTWISQMKKDALAAQNNQFSKGNYISNVQLTEQMFENLQNGLTVFEKKVNDPSVIQNASKLNNLVTNVISETKAESNIYQSSSVGTPMFTVLPFGSNFDTNIQNFESFSNSLGTVNQSVKESWVNNTIQQLQ